VSQGWEVCAETASGQEAVEIVQALPPDLIILDFIMPVKDGLQTAREILEMRPTLPIVLNTLYLTEQLRTLAQKIGVRAVVAKSNYEALMEALNSLLGGKDHPAPN
jgi:two-component system chemotaxis response regulator CheY